MIPKLAYLKLGGFFVLMLLAVGLFFIKRQWYTVLATVAILFFEIFTSILVLSLISNQAQWFEMSRVYESVHFGIGYYFEVAVFALCIFCLLVQSCFGIGYLMKALGKEEQFQAWVDKPYNGFVKKNLGSDYGWKEY